MKKIKSYLFLILGILASILLLINKLVVYALIVLIIAYVVNYVFKNFTLKNIEKLEEEKKLNFQLNKELEEIKTNKLNVLGLKEILDLGLLEVTTKLTRVWNRNIEDNERTLNFIGALEVELVAKFGLDLSKVRIKNNDDEILISNTRPHLISFSDLEYKWKISELLEYKEQWYANNHWRKSDDLIGYCNEIKDKFQKEVHTKIKNGPEELDWIINPLHSKIQKILSKKYSQNNKQVNFVDDYDDSFINLPL